ncbi:MAG: helicase-related protein [Zestosphaera sp.]
MSGKEVIKLFMSELFQEHPLFRPYLMGRREFRGYLHQAELLYRLVLREPIRALIADEIGLGKTVEAILLIDWGFRKKLFRKVLVLTPRSLRTQWEAELVRAGLNPLSSDYLDSEEGGVFLIKIDTAKKEPLKTKILRSSWDLIIIDEAHKIGLGTERYNFVKELVNKNSRASLLLLTATPHKGDPEDYLKRIALVDPGLDASAWKDLDHSKFYMEVRDAIVFRRSKSEVNNLYEKEKVFVDAAYKACIIEPTEMEKKYIEKLDELTKELLLKYGKVKGLELVAAIIDKRGLSSPEAGLKTFERVLESVSRPLQTLRDFEEDLEAYLTEDDVDADPDKLVDASLKFVDIFKSYKDEIDELRNLAREIIKRGDSKLNALISLINRHLRVGDKVVVFSEYADTARYVYERVREVFKNSRVGCSVELITGDMLTRNQGLLEEIKAWLSEPGPRVLVSTDVASEGLNLQQANVVIHYELPWSLVRLEQRAGRVWRLGQSRDVHVYSLITAVGFEQAVFNIVYTKLLNLVKARLSPSLTPGEAILSCGGSEVSWKLEPSAEGELMSLLGSTSEKLTSLEIWRTYKTKGRTGLSELVGSYISALENLKNEIRKTFHVDRQSRRIQVEEILRNVIGFTSREEVKSFLNEIFEVLNLRGKVFPTTSEEALISSLYNEASRTNLKPGLVVGCKSYDGELTIYRACAKLRNSERVCWLIGYSGGRVLSLSELVRELKTLSSLPCSVVSLDINKAVGGPELQKIKHYVSSEIIQKLINKYDHYLRYTAEKKFRNDDSLRLSSFEVGKPLTDSFIEVKPFLLIKKEGEKYSLDFLENVVGEYEESKLELENLGIELLKKALGESHVVTDVRELHKFDLLIKDCKTGLTRFVELKTLKDLDLIVITKGEKDFGEKLERDNQEYWLYVVDVSKEEVRAYRHPLGSNKLQLMRIIQKDGNEYYIYEEVGTPDEKREIREKGTT